MNKKLLTAFLLIFCILIMFCSISMASQISIDTNKLKDIYDTDNDILDVGQVIVGVVTYLCYGAAVIVLLVKGTQFMSKAPEAKAEAKKELVSYAVGAFILFGIGTIIKVIGTMAKNQLFG